jgi:hypothetical protein
MRRVGSQVSFHGTDYTVGKRGESSGMEEAVWPHSGATIWVPGHSAAAPGHPASTQRRASILLRRDGLHRKTGQRAAGSRSCLGQSVDGR